VRTGTVCALVFWARTRDDATTARCKMGVAMAGDSASFVRSIGSPWISIRKSTLEMKVAVLTDYVLVLLVERVAPGTRRAFESLTALARELRRLNRRTTRFSQRL